MSNPTENLYDFYLSNEEKIFLLKAARESLHKYFKVKTPKQGRGYFTLSQRIDIHTGAFVSLYKSGDLRGCIGRMETDEELGKLVEKMAVSAASGDHRFKSIKPEELIDLEIEISILTPKVKINSIDEFDISKHGIYIQKGGMSGTFLPQVAAETGWDKEELLGRCARDKAGIGWSGWKSADLFIYETIHFSERDFNL